MASSENDDRPLYVRDMIVETLEAMMASEEPKPYTLRDLLETLEWMREYGPDTMDGVVLLASDQPVTWVGWSADGKTLLLRGEEPTDG